MSEDDCTCDDHSDEFGQYERTCPSCGFVWRANHCPHDGVQNPCWECGWMLPGTQTPLQFLGWA